MEHRSATGRGPPFRGAGLGHHRRHRPARRVSPLRPVGRLRPAAPLRAGRRPAGGPGPGRPAARWSSPSTWPQFGGSALTDAIDVPKDRPRRGNAPGHPGHLRAGPEHRAAVAGPGLCRDGRRGRHLPRRQRHRLQRLPRLPARVHRGLRPAGQPGHQGGRRGPAALHAPHAADPHDQGPDHPPRHGAGRRLRPDPLLLRPRRRRRQLRPMRRLPDCGAKASPRRGSSIRCRTRGSAAELQINAKCVSPRSFARCKAKAD